MSLSNYDRRALGEIERWLTLDDPALARSLRKRCRSEVPGLRSAAVTAACGITVLILGVILPTETLVIAGLFMTLLFPLPLQIRAARPSGGSTEVTRP